jgi:geranyl-CoA carboxylase alpha subunit
VFADRHGNAIHLGERDCSVQRRHQKLIEEAPSPAVSAALRARMGAISVNAIRSIGYEGAGTLEFLLDRDGKFYFMEMNTRLQVEHPVTEAITGLDLVELQLRVAGGEPLGIAQDDVAFSGHAIEVRLCAEDAAHDFMPQSGRMGLWRMPEGLRVEHALQSGSEIPPFYDSMIAKIVSFGATRDEARRKLIDGIEHTVALGVTTNQALLASCLRHPAFAAGKATTGFITQHRELAHVPANRQGHAPTRESTTWLSPMDMSAPALAALLLYVTEPHASPWRKGRSLAATFPLPLRFDIDGRLLEPEIVRERDGGFVVDCFGNDHRFDIDDCGRDSIRFRVDGLSETADFFRDSDRLFFLHRGAVHSVRDMTRVAAGTTAPNGSDGKVRAAMNGRVVAVLVKPGDRVEAGQPIMTLEAMKMEHVHTAPLSGIIAAVDVVEAEQVTTGKIVATIEAAQPA